MFKYKKVPIIKLLFILLLISQYGFFMLIPIPKITRGLAYTPWVPLIIIILMLLTMGRFKPSGFKIHIGLYIGINIISFLGILIRYQQLDTTAYSALGYSLLGLVYFPVRELIKKEDIYSVFAKINLIAMILILLQVVYYNYTHQLLLPSINLEKLEIRNGLRITYYDFMIMTSLMISIVRITDRNRLIHILNTIISIFYIIYVSQTRFLELAIILVIGFQIVWTVVSDLKNGVIHTMYIFLGPIIILGVIYVTTILFMNLITPILNGSYLGNGSYFARLGEITYYSEIIKMRPILGLGNFTAKEGSELWKYLHGPDGIFYTQDIGFFGDIARLGIGILGIFLLILKKIISKDYFLYVNLGLITLIAISMGSISIFTNGLTLGLILGSLTRRTDDESLCSNTNS